jgi:hypothetical protein
MLTTSPELKRPEVSRDNAPVLKLEVKPRESLETRLTSTNWASFAQSTVTEQEFYSLYDRLDRSGYFERIPANSDSPFIRWAKAPFDPEVEHLGRTTVGGSLLTAIKRKNPFCLLKIDELLSISW